MSRYSRHDEGIDPRCPAVAGVLQRCPEAAAVLQLHDPAHSVPHHRPREGMRQAGPLQGRLD